MNTKLLDMPATVRLPDGKGELGGGSMRAYRLLFLTVLLRPFGNLSLAWGMKHIDQLLGLNVLLYAGALLNPYVAVGIGLLILSLLTRMALLSIADLSFVLPLTAIGYIITTVLGKVFLNEQVSLSHWIGTGLVFVGVILVSSTSLRTSASPIIASSKGSLERI